MQSEALRRDRLLSHKLTPIWRQMGHLTLQVTTPTLAKTLHHDAKIVFYKIAAGDIRNITMRIHCFVEALYHLTQEAAIEPSEQSSHHFTQDVYAHLDGFLSPLKDDELFDEHLHNLSGLLESDQELRAELKRVGEPDTLQQLISIIRRYMR